MIKIEVDNKTIEANQGEMILDALERSGITVPTLCHMKDKFPSGACRMCMVELDGANGLIPSCAFPVREGMKLKTHSPRVVRARKTIIELLLADHPDDCLYCVRNGNCELQTLSEEYGVRQRRFSGKKHAYNVDNSSMSIIRDPDKCILCGRCVRVCEETQGVAALDFIGRGCDTVVGTAFNEGLNVSSCVNCGQCIMVCPTGALRENSSLKEVIDALNDPEMTVVVQHAPAVSVTLAEEFNMKAGSDICGLMTAALRNLGFDRVFDTGFSADLTIMEEASELAHRIKTGGVLPMMTSCSPGWIKYVEQYYPDFIDNLSTCKSPQQMMGAVIKSYFAEKQGIDPRKIFSVSVMPCTAKKFEADRAEMSDDGITDVDAVLTTRELARLIRLYGIDINKLEPETADTPFGKRSSAGKLFAATGGVMEAAARTAHYLLTGKELADLKIKPLRGMKGIKEAQLKIGDLEVKIAVVSGLENAKNLLEEIKAGRKEFHFIEVMTCPGGCINGGGQPYNTDMDAVRERMQALYNIDRDAPLRVSHKNSDIQSLYDDYLKEPLSEKSHHLLHTHYHKRDTII
ncbi:MAG: [FeFe] hydrogenase, group A [Phycisphaerae bacterium]|nr:[FeFe] hydrogenase, group A [Phycisphaerae bacterium]